MKKPLLTLIILFTSFGLSSFDDGTEYECQSLAISYHEVFIKSGVNHYISWMASERIYRNCMNED